MVRIVLGKGGMHVRKLAIVIVLASSACSRVTEHRQHDQPTAPAGEAGGSAAGGSGAQVGGAGSGGMAGQPTGGAAVIGEETPLPAPEGRKVRILSVNALAFADGTFLAVGSAGFGTEMEGLISGNTGEQTEAIFVSSNGVEWERVFEGQRGSLDSAAAGNGVHVALTTRGSYPYHAVAYVSENAREWEEAPMPGSIIGAIAFGNGTFVAIDWGRDQLYTSTDARNWNVVESPAGIPNEIQSFDTLAFGAGVFVATKAAAIFVSEDGSSWQQVTSTGPPITHLHAVDDGFVAVLRNDCCSGEQPELIEIGYATSVDGSSWTVTEQIEAAVTLPVWQGTAGCTALRVSASTGVSELVSGPSCDSADEPLGHPSIKLAAGDHFLVAAGGAARKLLHSSDGLDWTVVLEAE